jgi:3-hydroxybutyryl-CoA dehydrogenase
MLVNEPATIYASNTSSISVTAIAEKTAMPSQLAGMHFFNPAPIMQLVEIVQTTFINTQVTDTLLRLAKQMGKTPVLCKDAPGFIVNRVARHYYLEAMLLVEQGHTDMKTIDTIMEATGFKMGPFALMDLIGLDINYAVSNIVWESLGKPKRLTPSALQKQKVDTGDLGKKTGKGFYSYRG